MTTLTISIIVVFVLGYALIATESLTKVNKAAIALLMLVGCWTLYMMDPMQYLQLMHPDYTGGAAGMVEKVTGIIQEHLGDTATTRLLPRCLFPTEQLIQKAHRPHPLHQNFASTSIRHTAGNFHP